VDIKASADQRHYPLGGEAASQVKPTPMANLYEALKRLTEAGLMARATADQLCGSQPEAVGKEPASQAASFFGQIDDIAEAVNAHASRIMGDMQRIHNRL
jgi:hypothetical protein